MERNPFHFPPKSYKWLRAFILSVLAGIEKTMAGKCQAGIDAKEAYLHNGFTESNTDLWESLWKGFIANNLGGGGYLPLAAAIQHCRGK
jgi:hypothetical protein